MVIPKYGDEILIHLGAGEFLGTVMHVDDAELEFSTDGGDTSKTVWLDDIVGLDILTPAD